MKPINHLGIGGLFVAVSCLFISIFVFLKDRKKWFNRIWMIFSISVAIFGFGFFKVDTTPDKETALFWWRFMYVGVVFITVLYLHFNYVFFEIKNRKIFLILYPVYLIFLVLDIFSPLFFKSVTWKFSSIWYADAGPLFKYFAALWWLTAGWGLFINAWKLRRVPRKKQLQISYWMTAFIIGFFGGILCYLPIFNINIYPYTIYLIGIWPIILMYAFIRFQLWEIDTVIHKTLLWLITSFLIFIPFCVLVYFFFPLLVQANRIQFILSGIAVISVYLYIFPHLQPKIDHLFRRRKFDYQTILGKIAEKLSMILDFQEFVSQFLLEISQTMYLRNSMFFIYEQKDDRYHLAARWGYREPSGTVLSRLEIFGPDNAAPQDQSVVPPLLAAQLTQKTDILDKESLDAPDEEKAATDKASAWCDRTKTELLIPVIFKDRITGILCLGKKENLQYYTIKDRSLLRKIGREAGAILFNVLHYKDLIKKERMDQELKLASQIQMNLLPAEIPDLPDLSLSGLMMPAHEIGGDYFDFILSENSSHLNILIGDVAGKGLAAGLCMTMVKSIIHIFSRLETSPKEILLNLNREFYLHFKAEQFMTMLYFIYDRIKSEFTYSSAGHEHILFYKAASQELEVIESGGMLLGTLPDLREQLKDKTITLCPKDKILLYTDGAIDLRDETGERLKLAGLTGLFLRHIAEPAPRLISSLKEEFGAFMGSQPQYDDITLLVIEKK